MEHLSFNSIIQLIAGASCSIFLGTERLWRKSAVRLCCKSLARSNAAPLRFVSPCEFRLPYICLTRLILRFLLVLGLPKISNLRVISTA